MIEIKENTERITTFFKFYLQYVELCVIATDFQLKRQLW